MKILSHLSLVFGLILLLAGCSDSIVSSDTGNDIRVDSPSNPETASKARHTDLLTRALRADETAGKDDNGHHLGLIMKVNKSAVMERYRVLERYKLMERYKIMERYEYNDVIGGFAITVEDLEGLEDYNAFLEELDNDPDIVWYEPDFDVDMPEMTVGSAPSGQIIPWSVAAIGGTESWAQSGNGSGMVDVDVYVLDTGVAKAWNSDPDDDLWLRESIDFTDTLVPDASDNDGHGTHVAGIVGAIDDYDNVVGVAPGVSIHNFKVLGNDGTSDVSVVIAAVEELTRRKNADPATPIIVNLSLGENLGTELNTALDDAIDESIEAGVHYVIAAGNDGARAKHVTPAKVRGALTVGSYDVNGLFSSFSNWGSSVDILAPGENIISLSKDGTASVTMSGTSMAAAHVTGAVALYVAQHPSATPAEAKDYVLATAQSFVGGALQGTTNLSVWVGPEPLPASPTLDLQTEAPAFFDYALFSGAKLEIKKRSVVGDDGAPLTNANVHADEELKLEDETPRIEGFGTYAVKLNGDAAGVFNPNSNPSALPVHGLTGAVGSTGFDAASFAGLASQTFDGNWELPTTLAFSADPNAPTLIFVDGTVKIKDGLSYTGYAVIFATGNAEIETSVTGSGALGIFVEGQAKVRQDGLTVEATLFGADKLELDDATQLYGSALTSGDLLVKPDSRIYFRPVPRSLTAPFWP